MRCDQLLTLVIRPVLKAMDAHSAAAERLLLMIAAHESDGFRCIAQVRGPAVGFYQMEPFTHDDLMAYLTARRPDVLEKMSQWVTRPTSDALAWNLAYATAMARAFFLRLPDPLPNSDDLEGLAQYAKQHWNTRLGKATWEDYLNAYRRYCE